jgi:hypothetical protein
MDKPETLSTAMHVSTEEDDGKTVFRVWQEKFLWQLTT